MLEKIKTKSMVLVPAVLGSTMLMSFPARAEGEVTAGVTEAVNVVKSVSTLFTEFPMNVFLGMGIAIAGFSVFRSAKRASKG